ncbi:MAG: endonuclease [Firmicutes bacterium]|nr:endonuclease [Bacillota bacterium]
MYKCEVCGRTADKHHIVHRSQGGIDFPLNIKHLCHEHHRGKTGPHKNRTTDIQYKLELQDKLHTLLNKEFYKEEELADSLRINTGMARKLVKELKNHKEGYRSKDIIYRLMGEKEYHEYMLEEFCEFIANF